MRFPILILSLIAIFSLSNFSSQTDSSIVIVQANEIDPASYKDLVLASLENDLIEIVEACVPAKLLMIKYSGTNTDEIKTFFSENAGLSNVILLTNTSTEEFTEKCHNARVGR